MLSIPKRGVRQGTNPNRFSPRSMGQFRDSEAAGLVLIPLHGPFDVRRIKDKIVEMGKAPADKDWTRKRYELLQWSYPIASATSATSAIG